LPAAHVASVEHFLSLGSRILAQPRPRPQIAVEETGLPRDACTLGEVTVLVSQTQKVVTPIDDDSLVAVDRFIQATRDSGYKGTPSAVAELVDNALQAAATQVVISIDPDPESTNGSLRVEVTDNGEGMDIATLQQALRFGGSTRFNDRRGLGRYGMGLPNSSLSQARRVDVCTWQLPTSALRTYLDVDEIASGKITRLPKPTRTSRPANAVDRA